ncbi:MAG: hypothetical protein ACHQVS_05035, partial [Candidatus Babeliales bacterium]
MVIKNRIALAALMVALFTCTFPVFPADQGMQLGMPMEDENKQEHEKKEKHEKDEKESAASLVDEELALAQQIPLPDIIRFDIPFYIQLVDRDGKAAEESVSIHDYEALTTDSFGTLIRKSIRDKTDLIIARVCTQMPDNSVARHYFDVDLLHQSFSPALKACANPINRQKIQHISYFLFDPTSNMFVFLTDKPNPTPAGIMTPKLRDELVWYTKALSLTKSTDSKQKELGKEMLITIIKDATSEEATGSARYTLACLYLDEDPSGAEKARQLLMSLVKIPGELSARAFAHLAFGYYKGPGEWKKDTKKALRYALKAVEHPSIERVPLRSRASAYLIAGELLIQQENHADINKALEYLERAVEFAKQTKQQKLKARAHALLAICYAQEPLYGKVDYDHEEGRYSTAWWHCAEALKEYDTVKDVEYFLELLVEMLYFALGNEGNTKKAFEYIEQYKKLHGGKELPDILEIIVAHNDYYCTLGKEYTWKTKEAALEAIKTLAAGRYDDTHEHYIITALLGEMYRCESERALEKARLLALTDPDASLEYNNQGRDLREKAHTMLIQLLKDLEATEGGATLYALSFACLTLGRIEEAGRNYAKASHYFEKAWVNKRKEFPLLYSNISVALYT